MTVYVDDEDHLGRMLVMKSDLTMLIDDKETFKTGATQLCWSGDDVPVLVVQGELVAVVRTDMFTMSLDGGRMEDGGVFLTNEIDGMRVITGDHTFFFDKVQRETEAVFSVASIEPAANLSKAKEAIDFNSPQADKLIRDLTISN